MPRRRRRVSDCPRVVYGPHGASMTINGPSEWPHGWSATPEGDTAPPEVRPAVIPLKRAEIKRRLRERGVPFKESAADAELYEVLLHG